MGQSWKDVIYIQREALAGMLRAPLEELAARCVPVWGDRQKLDAVLLEGFRRIPHCTYLYALGPDGVQVCDNIGAQGLMPEHFGRDRSARPYMREAVPAWGFLLSDAYISLMARRPSLTALQVVRANDHMLGYIGADFDLRDLPVSSQLYEDPGTWRQIKGDPAIRGSVFLQTRTDSPLDKILEQGLAILEELMTERGVFQVVIHFSSSRATVWTLADPYRYRILDSEVLNDPDICLAYPPCAYPGDAKIPADAVAPILNAMRDLRLADETLYLRSASINIFNGMISLTFSCDGSHYMSYDEFLEKNTAFWIGATG